MVRVRFWGVLLNRFIPFISLHYNSPTVRKFLALITLLLLTVTFIRLQKNIVTISFGDEEDNIALGHYLLRGEKLYKNLFTHHQPLGYIASAGVQKVTNPNSIYLLIKSHRLFVFAFSAIWVLFLVYKFNTPALLFAGIFEPIKTLLLGHLFLSESLAVYPLMYLSGLVLTNQKQLNKKEELLIGFSLSLVIFLLAPLWPLSLFLAGWFIFHAKNRKSTIIRILIAFIPLAFVSLSFISIRDYIETVFYLNFKYYIPQEFESSSLLDIFKPFLSPIIAFTSKTSSFSLRIIQALSLVLLIFLGSEFIRKHYRKAATIILILGLANIRYIEPGSEIYGGFHLLPWVALLVFTSTIALANVWRKQISHLIKGIILTLTILAIFLSFTHLARELKVTTNIDNSMFVNYSEQFSIGRAVEIMANGNQNEELFIAPGAWLVYWQSGVSHNSKMLNYYEWMSKTPELSIIVHTSLSKRPPIYIYCTCGKSLGLDSYTSLPNYTELQKENRRTYLYVQSSKLTQLNSDQLSQLEFLGFQINPNPM